MMRNHRQRCQSTIQVCLLLIWLLAAPAYPVYAQTLGKGVQSGAAQSGGVSRSELILAMNTLRVAYGLPALIEDPIINAVAQATAETMAANNMSSHIGDVRGRLAAAGYGGGATVWATENFAVGNKSIDEVMQTWADAEHMRPAANPAYCHVGAGVAQAANGRYYYILQAAYTSSQACGEYKDVTGGGSGSGVNPPLPVLQRIVPVKIATPDADGRVYHIVAAGQSFWSIAIAYQITIRDLEVWNNLSRDYGLAVGQKLFIPTSGTEGYATPTPVGMVLLSAPGADGKIVHEVQPYQTLITIAQAYSVDVGTILAFNGLQADWPLQIGQKLLIDPGKGAGRSLSAIEQLKPAGDGNYYHVVQSGEYLAWIADLYDVRLAELLAWNGLTSDAIIHPGQQLLLRVTPPATATSTPPAQNAASRTTPALAVPASTQEIQTPPPGAVTPAGAGEQRGLSGMAAAMGIMLVVAGLLLLGWVARRR
jgi:LysM repeat protein